MATDLPGAFIAVEGPDGSGKTQLTANLAAALRERYPDRTVIELREPGGCELSEHLRGILKGATIPGALTDPRAEALLFAAARAQLVAQVVRPALEAGDIILCDRWLHSSLIYQGVARELGVKPIRDISMFATDELRADLVLSLQVSAETAAARRHARDGNTGDRIEESLSAETIREGYANLADLDPHGVVEISAEGTPDEVLSEAMGLCGQLLDSGPRTAAQRHVDEYIDRGAAGFRVSVIAVDGVTVAEAEEALQEAVDAGRIVRRYGLLHPDSGRTIAQYDTMDEFPIGQEVDPEDGDEPFLVDERDVWVNYAVS